MQAKNVINDLAAIANEELGQKYARFFKTGKGEYGEGDIFIGIRVPEQHKIAGKYKDLDLKETEKLLKSKIHEHRLTALSILTIKFQKAKNPEQKNEIYKIYLKNLKHINNWDLVDLSAPKIVGAYLLDKPKDKLYKLAKSNDLWKKRVAILATFTFIKNQDFKDSLKISEILLNDKHDLIHKGVGWMLREIGKKDQTTEEKFLKKFYKKMPRTMLRYAIERFSVEKKSFYMQK